MSPPNSVHSPFNNGKYGLQAISVEYVIKISPFWILLASLKSLITQALPSTFPPQTIVPLTRIFAFEKSESVEDIDSIGRGTPKLRSG